MSRRSVPAETSLRHRMSEEQTALLYRRHDALGHEAAALEKLLAELFDLRAVEEAVTLVVRFKGTKHQEWALDLLERAHAGETDPENDPEDWEPPL